MSRYSNAPTQFQDINTLLIAIDWFGRILTVHTIGKFLYEQGQKIFHKKHLELVFWDGRINGLVPMMGADGKWQIFKDGPDHVGCLTCFRKTNLLFMFYDTPSEEIIPICKSCTKIVLQKLKKKEELFYEDQRAVWFKARIGISLNEEEVKIFNKYAGK